MPAAAKRLDQGKTMSGGGAGGPGEPGRTNHERLLDVLIVLALIYSAAILAASWNRPILDLHGFRQTQTAVTTYWLLHGGHWIAYETPIVGYPWTLPFEFPLFQWIAAAVSRTGLTVDQAGRLTSWLFFLAGLPLSGQVLRRLGVKASLIKTFWVLWLFSPLYVFWSRSFMIESCAVTLAIAFLAAVAAQQGLALEGRTRRRPVQGLLVIAMVSFAVMAALVKITTFVDISLAGGLFTLWSMERGRRAGWKPAELLGLVAPAAAAVVAALVVTHAWVDYSDGLKSTGLISVDMTSSVLRDWNFGTRRMLDPDMWRRVIFGRTLIDATGSPLPLFGSLLAAGFLRGSRPLILAALLLYLAPFFIFTNVNWVHDYYQFANAMFAILAVAAGIDAVRHVADAPGAGAGLNWPRLSVILLLSVVALELTSFYARFWPTIREDGWDQRTIAIADVVRRTTAPDSVVFGIGLDWTSELAYYSQRRAVMLPPWPDPRWNRTSTTDLSAWIGNRRLGVVVDCSKGEYPTLQGWIDRLETGRAMQVVDGCRLYR